jgi:hypothetical protein
MSHSLYAINNSLETCDFQVKISGKTENYLKFSEVKYLSAKLMNKKTDLKTKCLKYLKDQKLLLKDLKLTNVESLVDKTIKIRRVDVDITSASGQIKFIKWNQIISKSQKRRRSKL